MYRFLTVALTALLVLAVTPDASQASRPPVAAVAP